MNIFTWLKQRWWKHTCEHSEHFNGCVIPDCSKEVTRKPMPVVPPPGPPPAPKRGGFGRYYFESQKIAICVDKNSEVIINAPMDVSVHIVNNTINITTHKK